MGHYPHPLRLFLLHSSSHLTLPLLSRKHMLMTHLSYYCRRFLAVLAFSCLAVSPLAAQWPLDFSGDCQYASDKRNSPAYFAIPYRQGDRWGWSDTLGNLIIEPTFTHTRFFERPGANTVDDSWGAWVETEAGTNYYDWGMGLRFPAEIGIITDKKEAINPKTGASGDWLVVQSAARKVGLYHEKELVVDTIFVDFSWETYRRGKMYLQNEEGLYAEYDTSSRSFVGDPIRKIRPAYATDEGYPYFTLLLELTDGTYLSLDAGQTKPVATDSILQFNDEDEEDWVDFAFDELDEGKPGNFIGTDYANPVHPTIVDSVTYRYPWVEQRYGYSKLYIVASRQLLGVQTPTGREILPIRYDELTFTDGYSQIHLYKDGKEGRKLLFTTYPTIPAKYDELRPYAKLCVSKGWSFALFAVSHTKYYQFVGENGVEYFSD